MQKLLALLLCSIGCVSLAETFSASSPSGRVTSVELFTSHGCSSCPPADSWLSGLVDHPKLWDEFVPLAFHVDYWDWLGWADRFAAPAHSRRQRDYADHGAIATAYTPGFIINGQEWEGWFDGEPLAIRVGKPIGRLQVRGTPGQPLKLRFDALEPGAYQAHAALLGFALNSAIGGGENRGRTVRGDFVVLGQTHSEIHQGEEAAFWIMDWPRASPSSDRQALVVWVSEPPHPAPLQITGGWLAQPRPAD